MRRIIIDTDIDDAFTLTVVLDCVRHSSYKGILEVDCDDAGTLFQVDNNSILELVVCERGN